MNRMASKRGKVFLRLCVLVLMCCLMLLACLWLSGKVQHASDEYRGDGLGLMFVDILDEKAASSYHVDELGVYVLAVEEGSAAHQAGVQSGDRMVSVNNVPVKSTSAFAEMKKGFAPAQMVQIAFERGTEAHGLEVRLSWNADKGGMLP